LNSIDLTLIHVRVELCTGGARPRSRHVVAKLGAGLPAMISEQFGRIKGPAEEPPAKAALLRREQRGKGVLPIGSNKGGKAPDQRLQPAGVGFDLAEIDLAVRTGAEHVVIAGAAEAVEAVAEGCVDLVGAVPLVGEVA